MKKFLWGLLVTLLIGALITGCSDKLEESSYIVSGIQEASENADGGVISLDAVYDEEEWDTVLLDTAYNIKNALVDLKVKNRSSIGEFLLEDSNQGIVFIRDHQAVAYAQISTEVFDFAAYYYSYVYETYPKGTVFDPHKRVVVKNKE